MIFKNLINLIFKNELYILHLILLIAFLFIYSTTIPAEDAVILYEYSRNLSQAGLITYGNSLTPIEGATDFLWMVVIGVFSKMGVDEFLTSLSFSFLSVFLFAKLAEKMRFRPVIILLSFILTPYLYAAFSGFSALIFSFVYALGIYIVLKRKEGVYLTILILSLIRPDGIVWGLGLIFLKNNLLQSRDFYVIELKKCIIFLIIPGLLYFAWRVWYFDEWFPLPFYVKSSGDRDFLIFFKNSIIMISYALIPLFIVTPFTFNKISYLKKIFILFIFPVVFYAAMKLEQNIGNRFLAPMFFGGLILVGFEREKNTRLIYILFSVILSIKLSLNTLLVLLDSKDEQVYSISHDLSAFNGKMLTTEAGRLAYYTEWKVDDSWGLNTPRFAHNLINRNEIRFASYDLIVAHCPINFLLPNSIRDVNSLRTWENQCREITSFIVDSEYEVYLVPFLDSKALSYKFRSERKGGDCNRHDIYAISKKFDNFESLKNIFISHGGKLFDGLSMNYIDDKICL